jgi:DNA repair protein RecO (recombination protein O)
MLLPFQPLLMSWVGKGEVPTLTNAELDFQRFSGWDYELKGAARICGFYCNELLAALLQRGDPHPALFDNYQQTLDKLLRNTSETTKGVTNSKSEELMASLFKTLRDFELCLISESGYGVSLTKEANGTRDIQNDEYYEFVPKQGFVSATLIGQSESLKFRPSHYFQGHVIRSLSPSYDGELQPIARTQRKQIMRMILSDVLGHKRILSRDLFLPAV